MLINNCFNQNAKFSTKMTEDMLWYSTQVNKNTMKQITQSNNLQQIVSPLKHSFPNNFLPVWQTWKGFGTERIKIWATFQFKKELNSKVLELTIEKAKRGNNMRRVEEDKWFLFLWTHHGLLHLAMNEYVGTTDESFSGKSFWEDTFSVTQLQLAN